MYKYLFFLIAACLFSSCRDEQDIIDEHKSYVETYTIFNKVDYDGHTYIIINRGHGITHDPDCKCHNKSAKPESHD